MLKVFLKHNEKDFVVMTVKQWDFWSLTLPQNILNQMIVKAIDVNDSTNQKEH